MIFACIWLVLMFVVGIIAFFPSFSLHFVCVFFQFSLLFVRLQVERRKFTKIEKGAGIPVVEVRRRSVLVALAVWFNSGYGCVMMIGQLSFMAKVKHAHICISTSKCHQRQQQQWKWQHRQLTYAIIAVQCKHQKIIAKIGKTVWFGDWSLLTA